MQPLDDKLEGRSQRWAQLAEFAGIFLRQFTEIDSIASHDLLASRYPLPKALAEFYSICGNATDIWCRQDEWLKPAELREKDGVLIFWAENQGNWAIGVRQAETALEDPPVVWDAADWIYGVGAPGEFTVLTESVSTFALNMIAYVAKFFDNGYERPFGYTTSVDEFLDTIAKVYEKCHLQQRWVYGDEAYFQDAETFVEVNSSDGFVYPIFKTSSAESRFRSLIDPARFQWEIPTSGG